MKYVCIQDYVLNPKTLTLEELYGKYNLTTNEWMDGILSTIMRKICAGKILFHKVKLIRRIIVVYYS